MEGEIGVTATRAQARARKRARQTDRERDRRKGRVQGREWARDEKAEWWLQDHAVGVHLRYRQPSWQFKGFPGLARTRITEASFVPAMLLVSRTGRDDEAQRRRKTFRCRVAPSRHVYDAPRVSRASSFSRWAEAGTRGRGRTRGERFDLNPSLARSGARSSRTRFHANDKNTNALLAHKSVTDNNEASRSDERF